MHDAHEPHADGLAEPLGDTVLQSEILESIASAVNYHDWLTSLAAPYLGDHPIELGSGLGDYAQAWLDSGVPRITVTELDRSRLTYLRSRFARDRRVTVESIEALSLRSAEHSSFVAFNVLEHLPDHVGTLRSALSLVRPGGRVVMFVPAFGFAMSRFDHRVGHVRRYTVDSMRQALTAAGLEVERVRYVNLPGLPAWFLGMRLLRMTPSDGTMLRSWDRHVIPRARRWESRHHVPFGQSVFGVAHVPWR